MGYYKTETRRFDFLDERDDEWEVVVTYLRYSSNYLVFDDVYWVYARKEWGDQLNATVEFRDGQLRNITGRGSRKYPILLQRMVDFFRTAKKREYYVLDRIVTSMRHDIVVFDPAIMYHMSNYWWHHLGNKEFIEEFTKSCLDMGFESNKDLTYIEVDLETFRNFMQAKDRTKFLKELIENGVNELLYGGATK